MDTAHSIAFRRGLGNSLYASPHSPVSAAEVKSYAQQAFAKSNIAVLGAGISTDALAKAVQGAFGSGTGGSSLQGGSSQYYGGEARIPSHSQPTMVIAYGSAGSASPDLKVLPHLLGGESAVKWSAGSSPLSQAAAKVNGASAKAFLLPYSDASLFGVVVTAPTSEGVASVAKEVAGLMKAKPKDEEVKRAIAKAKFTDASLLERHESLIATAGAAIFSGDIPKPDASFASLSKVSASSLEKVSRGMEGANVGICHSVQIQTYRHCRWRLVKAALCVSHLCILIHRSRTNLQGRARFVMMHVFESDQRLHGRYLLFFNHHHDSLLYYAFEQLRL